MTCPISPAEYVALVRDLRDPDSPIPDCPNCGSQPREYVVTRQRFAATTIRVRPCDCRLTVDPFEPPKQPPQEDPFFFAARRWRITHREDTP